MYIHQLGKEGKKICDLVVIHASKVRNAQLGGNFNFGKEVEILRFCNWTDASLKQKKTRKR